VKRFRPDVLYGFDPWPALVEGESELEGTRVILARKAAWITDGEIEFARVQGLRAWDSTVMREKNSRREWSGPSEIIRVPCFDFSSWLRTLPEPPIVKLDVEGAEFPILERMVETGADALVTELLVEWHDDKMADLSRPKGDPACPAPLSGRVLGRCENEHPLDDSRLLEGQARVGCPMRVQSEGLPADGTT
jgi:FkbM family methyltransferase